MTFYRPEAEATPRKEEKGSEKIIRVIRENPSVSAQELANMLDILNRATEKHLLKLKVKGVLRRIGSDKGGHWEIIGK